MSFLVVSLTLSGFFIFTWKWVFWIEKKIPMFLNSSYISYNICFTLKVQSSSIEQSKSPRVNVWLSLHCDSPARSRILLFMQALEQTTSSIVNYRHSVGTQRFWPSPGTVLYQGNEDLLALRREKSPVLKWSYERLHRFFLP